MADAALPLLKVVLALAESSKICAGAGRVFDDKAASACHNLSEVEDVRGKAQKLRTCRWKWANYDGIQMERRKM